ncbi:hypothetical protein EHQ52_04185 [Leptospira koniambonensis]|uniref:Uncharacterized protein n=1 Tax=Leptospira koniambonensis TaxID=2484950 RepID=A0A4R9J7C7_9LEPT|nr:hypothetical protein [Leptospira koniambonensis]TGL33742.1 hypothetical protein EHQ52_04185 [Leptospira koniambonensis]
MRNGESSPIAKSQNPFFFLIVIILNISKNFYNESFISYFLLTNPEEFKYLRTPIKSVISEFDKPNLLFTTGESKEFVAKIENGIYHFQSFDGKSRHIKSLFTIPYEGDFEIEASVLGRKDKPQFYVGIALVDLNDGEDFIESTVNLNGSFSIDNQEKWILRYSDRKNKNDKFQIITIRKIGSDLFFFLDGSFRYKHTIGKVKNFKVAISTGDSDRGSIEYFKIIRY